MNDDVGIDGEIITEGWRIDAFEGGEKTKFRGHSTEIISNISCWTSKMNAEVATEINSA